MSPAYAKPKHRYDEDGSRQWRSGRATSYVVDKSFQNALAACLKRGVNVFIGYGYKAGNEPRPEKRHETEAKENLKALQAWCDRQEPAREIIVLYYPNHTKHLICNQRFAVCGSFNGLSNMGRSLNEERSWVVYDEEFISNENSIVLSGLMSPLKGTKRDPLKTFVPWSNR